MCRAGRKVTATTSVRLCVAPPAPERAFAALEAAGVAASLREGAIRLSPHAYNTVEELARVAEVLERAR